MTSPSTPTRATGAAATEVEPPARPWWRERMMWLVVGGPVAAVVASLGTVVVAYRYVDPLVQDVPSASQVVRPTATTPAHQARNHAATAAPR